MFASRVPKKDKKNKRKRASENDEAATDNTGEDGPIVPVIWNRRKVNTFSSGGSKRKRNAVESQQVESSREVVPQQYAGDATYETQIDTAADRDARAVLERNIKANEDGSADQQSGKVYRGQAAYKNYIAKKESQIGANKYSGTQGPIRAQTWSRAISRFDYQPDICKDYKETGFCGYGDSCVFLHDRSDYKSGWQLEKEWEEEQRKKQKKLQEGGQVSEEEDEDDKYVIDSDEDEQFACTICRGPFRNAIQTVCGHYFCEECALQHFQKSSRCFNCRKQTNGIFTAAEHLRKKEQTSSPNETHDMGRKKAQATSSWTVVDQ